MHICLYCDFGTYVGATLHRCPFLFEGEEKKVSSNFSYLNFCILFIFFYCCFVISVWTFLLLGSSRNEPNGLIFPVLRWEMYDTKIFVDCFLAAVWWLLAPIKENGGLSFLPPVARRRREKNLFGDFSVFLFPFPPLILTAGKASRSRSKQHTDHR